MILIGEADPAVLYQLVGTTNGKEFHGHPERSLLFASVAPRYPAGHIVEISLLPGIADGVGADWSCLSAWQTPAGYDWWD